MILKNVNLPLLKAIQRGKKFKKCWAFSGKKSPGGSILALEYLDKKLSDAFGPAQWPSARVGLLSLPKYAAVINNQAYVSNSAIKQDLGALGAVDLLRTGPYLSADCDEWVEDYAGKLASVGASHAVTNDDMVELNQDQTSSRLVYASGEASRSKLAHLYDTPVRKFSFCPIPEENATWYKSPIALSAMTFARNDFSQFPPPPRDQRNLLAYYLLDGASLLPVVALNVDVDDVVLDMCSSPGGKSLAILQTSLAAKLICNDVSVARVNRLKSVFARYCRTSENIHILKRDATEPSFIDDVLRTNNGEKPNKVLVDVPCTNDRHSLFTNEQNIFSRKYYKQMAQLTKLQKDLLINAMKICAPGGTVVYSTCTLCPQQNDMIVEQALQEILSSAGNLELNCHFEVISNKSSIEQDFRYFFKFCQKTHYGSLVVPNIISNFGPTYFCRIRKSL